MKQQHRAIFTALFACALLAGGCASSDTGAKFSSPDAAVDSFVGALRAKDSGKLKKIFGPGSEEIISSGDAVADENQAEKFLAAYDAKHHLETNPDGVTTTLIVGNQDFPFPVPITRLDGNKYVFDTPAGEDEILNRRIGRNELETQQVCLAIVDAQNDYVRQNPMNYPIREYAQKLLSDPGKKNGLYWQTKDNEPPSPLGPLVAEASEEGYAPRKKGEAPPPFHGYYYKLLTAQGPHAIGGEADYLVDGHLIGGFAIVAWPAQYGNSGIKTFLINHNDILYEQDFGDATAETAKAMKTFDPGPGWTQSKIEPIADTATASSPKL